ncbi:hypothetical protein TNCV_4740351 [Trichonephila clavipes]|nr:hypothetical protein TNCV_4740351 [Trichonephila clavipes]
MFPSWLSASTSFRIGEDVTRGRDHRKLLFLLSHGLDSEKVEKQMPIRVPEQSPIPNYAEPIKEVSLDVTEIIAKEGRSFTDGDFVKNCLSIASEKVCPEAKENLKILA